MLVLYVPFCGLFDEFLLVDLALTFFDRDDPVHADARDLIDRAAGPTHLDRINFRAFLESEVQPQIALRDVTVATAHLIGLRQVAGRRLSRARRCRCDYSSRRSS